MPSANNRSHSFRPTYYPRSVHELVAAGVAVRCLQCGQVRKRVVPKRLDMWWVYKAKGWTQENPKYERNSHAGTFVAESCPHCGGVSWDIAFRGDPGNADASAERD